MVFPGNLRKFFFAGTALLLCLAGQARGREVRDFPHLAEAESLLAEGKALDALNTAAKGLEYMPYDARLLDLASRAAETLDAPDVAIFYAALALEALRDEEPSEASKEMAPALEARIAGLDPLHGKSTALFESYAASLFKLAGGLVRKKLYANAVDLYHLCEDTRFHERAREQLEKLYDRQSSVQALLDTGINVPVKPTSRYSKKWLAREDKKHEDWASAYEFKTDNYTVITNMGYEIGKTLSLAMEQMNRFYRDVFQHKARGGGTARCTIRVFRSRADFDRHTGREISPTVRGFYAPFENSVTTYDPRTDGRSLSSLWSTLFHEASHQFTHLVSTGVIPGWLNEGTACYFEGARIRASGIVEKNLIPSQRLAGLIHVLDEGRPALKEVISYYAPGSYDGSYYPVGWGLVYYFHNYENERSERIYVPLFRSYMKTYKSDEKHDPVARFVEYFVDRARVPGVKTLEDFEKHFAAWIRELSALHFGGAEAADRLMERARKQRGNGALEYAKESYRWAIEKQPEYIPAHFELAQVLTDLDEIDGAVYHYRKVLKTARGRADPEMPIDGFEGMTADDMILVCTALIEDLDSSFTRTLGEADEDFAQGAVDQAKDYAGRGMPRRAIRLVQEAAAMLGGHGPLETLGEEIREASKVDTRRWRRLPVWDGLKEWDQLAGAWSSVEEAVRIEGTHLCFALYREEMPERYRFQALIRMKEAKGLSGAGLVFGANLEKGLLMAGPFGHGGFLLSRLKEAPEVLEKMGFFHPEKLDEVVLAVEVRPGRAEFFLNDESIGSHRFSADEPSGRVGLFCQGCTAEFTDIKMRY